jgi:hypothetical protein
MRSVAMRLLAVHKTAYSYAKFERAELSALANLASLDLSIRA